MKKTKAFRLGFVGVCLLLSLSQGVFALSPRYIPLECPVDGKRFTTTGVGSMTTMGRRSDFAIVGPIDNLYGAIVHSCPHCHFSGTEADFKQKLSPEFKARVLQTFAAYKPHQNLDELDEIDLALALYQWQNRSAEEKALLALAGSYLAPGPEFEDEASGFAADNSQITVLKPVEKPFFSRKSLYQARSLYWFRQALEANEIAPERRIEYIYLVGEFSRRFGQFETAKVWFRQALELLPPLPTEDDPFEQMQTKALRDRIMEQYDLAQRKIADALD